MKRTPRKDIVDVVMVHKWLQQFAPCGVVFVESGNPGSALFGVCFSSLMVVLTDWPPFSKVAMDIVVELRS